MRKITVIALMLFTALGYAQGIELNGTISAEDNQIKNLQDPTTFVIFKPIFIH